VTPPFTIPPTEVPLVLGGHSFIVEPQPPLQP
jgi:hypothetical protein